MKIRISIPPSAIKRTASVEYAPGREQEIETDGHGADRWRVGDGDPGITPFQAEALMDLLNDFGLALDLSETGVLTIAEE